MEQLLLKRQQNADEIKKAYENGYYKESLDSDARVIALKLRSALIAVESGIQEKQFFVTHLQNLLLNYHEKHFKGDPNNEPKVQQPPKSIQFIMRMTHIYTSNINNHTWGLETVVSDINTEVIRYFS